MAESTRRSRMPRAAIWRSTMRSRARFKSEFLFVGERDRKIGEPFYWPPSGRGEIACPRQSRALHRKQFLENTLRGESIAIVRPWNDRTSHFSEGQRLGPVFGNNVPAAISC